MVMGASSPDILLAVSGWPRMAVASAALTARQASMTFLTFGSGCDWPQAESNARATMAGSIRERGNLVIVHASCVEIGVMCAPRARGLGCDEEPRIPYQAAAGIIPPGTRGHPPRAGCAPA